MVLLTSRHKRSHISLPRSLVEVDSEKPTRFVLQERIDTGHKSTLQVIEEDLVCTNDLIGSQYADWNNDPKHDRLCGGQNRYRMG